MRPDHLALQILVGMLAFASTLAGLLLLLLVVLFISNFHFTNLWHLWVFCVTATAPFLALSAYFGFLSRPTWKRFGVSLIASSGIGLTWLLLTAPLSRGLIH